MLVPGRVALERSRRWLASEKFACGSRWPLPPPPHGTIRDCTRPDSLRRRATDAFLLAHRVDSASYQR